ncbi:hypothetical protein JHK87_007043 [Glycine soja]|nr:hypothetical protein JHK87_007043 [Glycine soja]
MILIHPWLSRSITKDLILLEDQIPFFVLEKLYDDVVPDYTGFVDLVIEYFAFYNTQMFYSIKYKKQFFSGSHRSSSKSTKHFTDLIRFDYLPVGIAVKSGYARHVLRTATKLRDSGVSFEKGDVRRSLLDI